MTFASVAFTMGMCYHVSDTTSRNRQIRRTPLSQAFLSYPLGGEIVGGSVNVIACLIRAIPAVKGWGYSSTGRVSSRM
jgi:uncharacterized membrane protein